MSALTDRVMALLPNARLHSEDDSNDIIIWGPPGTGKTTSLSTILDAHLKAGHEPDRLLVNAFTRNATAELRGRVQSAFGVDLPWLRTIHSSCFSLLGLRSEQVVQYRELERFGLDSGYELKGALGKRSLEDPYGGVSVTTVGDWCYAAEELRRQRRQTLEEAVRQLRPPALASTWNLEMAQDFSRAYAIWKREKDLHDFTDMLELVLENQIRPPVATLFVDEAQDNTPLIWAVIDFWRIGAERIFTFGDSDQAIFEWSGADPAGLMRRPGSQFVLSRSYRLNERVRQEARTIIRRVRDRVQTDFEPDRPGGEVLRRWDWMDVPLEREGSWFLLCRNRVFLREAAQQLTRAGVAFRDRTSDAGVPDLDGPLGRAANAALRLAAGEVLPRLRLRHLRGWVQEPERLWPTESIGGPGALVDLPEMGATPELVQRLRTRPLGALRLAPERLEYLEAVMAQDGALSVPRLELSTVHGVKGEESAHVAVSTAMTNRTYQDYQTDPDAENRVFYVAATRARESLTWIVNGGKGFVI